MVRLILFVQRAAECACCKIETNQCSSLPLTACFITFDRP